MFAGGTAGNVVMVFSHPNHEIAVLGTIGRTCPDIVFLTDGGGEDRVAQSKAGLAAYVDPEKLHFLNHSEARFYEALLDCDTGFCASVAAQVRGFANDDVAAVCCDAVEFYNPVHDMALPIVRAALARRHRAAIYEVPLIHQAKDGHIEMQRVPGALEAECIWCDLSDDELSRKVETLRGGQYRTLFGQLGDLITAAIPTRARREQFLPARRSVPQPTADQALRYDERGAALKSSGVVPRAITYREHYVPLLAGLARQRV